MKKEYILYLIFILAFSCKSKQDNNEQNQLSRLDVKLDETILSNKSDSIDFSLIPRLTQAQHDSLQLVKILNLVNYDANDLSLGRILLENENGKLLTILILTEGEITEYLLSYDKEGNLSDNLLVAYEDLVEYYSQISTIIKSNGIAVQTINFNYDDFKESSDTTITQYTITPELKFIPN